jgi:hypothetical protein
MKYKNSSKYVLWEPIFFQCEQTDRTKLIVALRNFVDAPENHIDSDSRLYLGTVLTVFLCVTGDTALTVRYEM